MSATNQQIAPEIEEAQARLWEFIHSEEDPEVYDQANADLDVIYSALLGSVEQYEVASRERDQWKMERDGYHDALAILGEHDANAFAREARRYAELQEQLEAAGRELEETRADLYQCKREREILSRNLSAFTGNA